MTFPRMFNPLDILGVGVGLVLISPGFHPRLFGVEPHKIVGFDNMIQLKFTPSMLKNDMRLDLLSLTASQLFSTKLP